MRYECAERAVEAPELTKVKRRGRGWGGGGRVGGGGGRGWGGGGGRGDPEPEPPNQSTPRQNERSGGPPTYKVVVCGWA